MAFDLRVLRYFVQIAELGSISRAAKVMHIAQPALTQQLAGLEAHLGVELLTRSRRGVTLTSAGRILLDGAHTVLREARLLEESVSVRSGVLSGEVRFGIPAPAAIRLIPPLVTRLRETHPHLRLHIEEGMSPQLVDALVGGQLDIIVTAITGESQRIDYYPLAQEAVYLVGGPDSDLSDHIRLADIGDRPLILSTRPHPSQAAMSEEFMRVSGKRANVVLESSSLATTKLLVHQGDLFSIMTWAAAGDDIERGWLRGARVIEPEVIRHLYVATMHDRARSELITTVLKAVKRVTAELVRKGALR